MKFYYVQKMKLRNGYENYSEQAGTELFEKKSNAQKELSYQNAFKEKNEKYSIQEIEFDINLLNKRCSGLLPYYLINGIRLTEKE